MITDTYFSNKFSDYYLQKMHALASPLTTINVIGGILQDEEHINNNKELLEMVEALIQSSHCASMLLKGCLIGQIIDNDSTEQSIIKQKVSLVNLIERIVLQLGIYYNRKDDFVVHFDKKKDDSYLINLDQISFLLETLILRAVIRSSKGKLIMISFTHTLENECQITITDFSQNEIKEVSGIGLSRHCIGEYEMDFYQKIARLNNSTLSVFDKPMASGSIVLLKFKKNQ